jgi:hypothetical protein
MTLTAERDTAIRSDLVVEIEQGVIEEARRRQRTRRLRLGGAATALAAAAGIVALTAAGGAKPSEPPLHLPPEPAPLSAQARANHRQALAVQLSPDIHGGQAGWCMYVIEPSGGGGGGCPPLPTRNHPVIAGGTGWSVGEPDATTVDVVAPRVAYMLVNGSYRVTPRALPGLPFGMRAVVVHTPYRPTQRARMEIPKLIPFDAAGHRIIESADYGSGLPVRIWNPPSPPAGGACGLKAAPLPGLKTEWGQVATAIRPYAGAIVGRGFLSCIDTEYYVPGRGMRAAVLLDAANPGRTPPAPIPGLSPIPQAPGLFNGSGDYGFLGPMTAKREGGAWVVVTGGGRDAEASRIRLLRHLTATVHL